MAAILAVGLAACRSTTPSAPTGGPSEMREQGMGEAAGSLGGESWRAGSDAGLTTIYFDYDASALRPDAKDGLKANAGFLRSNPGSGVLIEGNCDERGSEEYNLALGMRRAEAAKRYLMDLGIEGSRLTTISYGEERPAEPGSSEAAWAKNRRDDFKIRR
jgi:peptidoglycan-associated lipoprotein